MYFLFSTSGRQAYCHRLLTFRVVLSDRYHFLMLLPVITSSVETLPPAATFLDEPFICDVMLNDYWRTFSLITRSSIVYHRHAVVFVCDTQYCFHWCSREVTPLVSWPMLFCPELSSHSLNHSLLGHNFSYHKCVISSFL